MKRNKHGCYHRTSGPIIGPGRFNNAFAGRVSKSPTGYVDDKRFYQIMGRAPTEGLAEVPQSAQGPLNDASYRYMCFMGLVHSEISAQTLEDRQRFAHLYTKDAEGHLVTSDRNQAEFMHQVSGLPREMCVSAAYGDLVELVAAGIVEGDPDEVIRKAYEEALAATADVRGGRRLWEST